MIERIIYHPWAVSLRRKSAFLWALLFFAAIAPEFAAASGAKLAEVAPESLGFASDRLKRLDATMQRFVDDKRLAGIVTLVARHGRVASFQSFGSRSLATAAPMEKDTIFRLYSMSKPMTAVAMMILYEEGKWNPLDPIAKYIPEFAKLQVLKSVETDGRFVLERAEHGPTVRELLTHTAGFVYGLRPDAHWTPIDEEYEKRKILESSSLQEMIGKLSELPLLYQPGSRFRYSIGVDIQGYLVEKLSGKSLPEFLRERLFRPLGMDDTGFYVPKAKWDRFAASYNTGRDGGLAEVPDGYAGVKYDHEPSLPSGGAGMVSTAADYFRFAQMLLNGGQLNGVRILAPSSVNLMRSNHLAPALTTGTYAPIRPGYTFGYGVAIYTEPELVDSPVGKGTFLWGGAADTIFWVDPANDVIFVGLTQHLGGGEKPNLGEIARPLVYSALVELNR